MPAEYWSRYLHRVWSVGRDKHVVPLGPEYLRGKSLDAGIVVYHKNGGWRLVHLLSLIGSSTHSSIGYLSDILTGD